MRVVFFRHYYYKNSKMGGKPKNEVFQEESADNEIPKQTGT